MATKSDGEDFVTIVPVGEARSQQKDPAFVTVLTVGAAEGAAEVSVNRPRGARLGLGLKFEGGSAAAENVRRLLVQSCAEESPAAKAATPWGKLIPGDEILAIDGVSVSELTRIDCVRRLKDSDETLKLLVRHFEPGSPTETTDSHANPTTEIPRPMLPPPVPPRKLGKKNSFKEKSSLHIVGEQNAIINIDTYKQKSEKDGNMNGTNLVRKSSFDSHIFRQNRENIACLKKGSPEEVRRLVRRLSDGKNMPPDAEVYIDLLTTECRNIFFGDAESDDTGSSISTVVDKLSSMASSVENSIPSTPIMQNKTIDIQKVLNCIENIDSNILKDITGTKIIENIKYNGDSKNFESKNIPNGNIVIENKKPTSVDEVLTQTKNLIQNDKNNNNTVITNGKNTKTNSENTNEMIPNNHAYTNKPKPMPRTTKAEKSTYEKKSKAFSNLDMPICEPHLTPTKKSNIETWLQRSEAEMNSKSIEKFEESHVQEILPRLIDFVPKHQFKESGSESGVPTPMARPTAPPPPPPSVEVREDGSGASLDTIGELDESTDVVDSGKINNTERSAEKKAFDRGFWEDRITKSDAEDKSLSNDESPLPTCPRQPPDGVETPSESVEKVPDLPTRLPPRLPTWISPRPRYSYLSRLQDARSEASVKDKIAMFSNDNSTSTEQIDKCGTLPVRNNVTAKKSLPPNYTDVTSLDRRLTKSQDNLDEVPRPYKRNLDRPQVLGAVENPSSNNKCYNTGKVTYTMAPTDTKPLFYGSTSTLPLNPDTSYKKTTYHVRSVSDDNGKKDTYKSHLEYLIEQRKKSMSKLRGLVIPETQVQGPIVDLPEIKVQETLTKPVVITSTQHKNNNNKMEKEANNTKSTLSEAKWKANLLSNNLPKYSPAFKRKSLQVYSSISLSKEPSPERKFNEKVDILNSKSFLKPLVNSTDSKFTADRNVLTKYSNSSSPNSTLLLNKDYKHINNDIRDYRKFDVKVCTVTDVIDSDNDSAMSSTQSSYRSSASSPMHNLENIESDNSRLSPKTHFATYSIIKTNIPTKVLNNNAEYLKRNVCRSVSSDTNVSLSSSSGSAATSGSQASCSSLESSVADSDKRRVSKPHNIDSINRRNILASAKCRSGRDAKMKSPVIEAKFSHESYDRSPSPTNKTSERFSTLTSSVSAISNKGENRRRSKIIAETDSDSDAETNIRQRKNEYKNMRLKRSSSNKQKTSDIPDVSKAESVRKSVYDINGKDYKKDIVVAKMNILPLDKNNCDIKKIEAKVVENHNKVETIAKIVEPNHCETVGKTEMEDLVGDYVDNKSIKQNDLPTYTIRLQRGSGSGVGLILAGGTDCEAKDVTIHRILSDSVADKAGLKRGSKIRSINGSSMTGLTHAQSVTVLKEQRSEIIIEIEKENNNTEKYGSPKAESKAHKEAGVEDLNDKESDSSVVRVLLEKAGGGAGLGFGLDGGRDSPFGDRPLTIKKLFAGGAAAVSGEVLVGAELLSAGGITMENLTRTQAWAALKNLPSGPVTLVLRNP